MKSLSAIALLVALLSVTGCTSSPEVNERSRGDFSYEEISSLDDYTSYLSDSCDTGLAHQLNNLSFLPLRDGTVTSAKDVMVSRTGRIQEATGDLKTESKLLDETNRWEGSVEGEISTDWKTPTQSLSEMVLTSVETNLYPPLFQGESPKIVEVKDRVLEDWLVECGVKDEFDSALKVTTEYEQSLRALVDGFKKRFTAKGFQDYGVGLVKMTAKASTLNFSFVMTSFCSLEAQVIFDGVPDQDGITPATEVQTVHLSHSSDFAEISISEPIKDFVLNQSALYNIKEARLEAVRCS